MPDIVYTTGMRDASLNSLEKAQKAVAGSGLTHQEVGLRMGYSQESARQMVSRFLHSPNPSVAMLRRLARALGVPPGDLI
jgi:transcriptional regulator with XRE-family HTH domain